MDSVESSTALSPVTDTDVSKLQDSLTEDTSRPASIARHGPILHHHSPAKKRKVSPLDDPLPTPDFVTPSISPPVETLDALYAIHTTPYENSFACRLTGLGARIPDRLIAVDWETATAWMNVMADIREHYVLKRYVVFGFPGANHGWTDVRALSVQPATMQFMPLLP
jgi:hypothetical protein